MSCSPVLEHEGLVGPDESVTTFHADLAPRPRSASEARSFVSGLDLPLEDDGMAVLVLLTSELVTNAVLHARTAVSLGVTVTDTAVVVTVGDSSKGRPEQRPYGELIGTNGRGILLVEELAQRWGVTYEEGGKWVWFTVERSRMRAGRK